MKNIQSETSVNKIMLTKAQMRNVVGGDNPSEPSGQIGEIGGNSFCVVGPERRSVASV